MFLKHFFHLNIISKRCFQIHSSFQHFPQPFLTQIFKTGNFYCRNASLSVSPSCSLYYISNICKKKKAQQNNTILVLSKFLLQLCTKHEAIDPWPLISMKQCILLSGSQWAAASVLDSTLEVSSISLGTLSSRHNHEPWWIILNTTSTYVMVSKKRHRHNPLFCGCQYSISHIDLKVMVFFHGYYPVLGKNHPLIFRAKKID